MVDLSDFPYIVTCGCGAQTGFTEAGAHDFECRDCGRHNLGHHGQTEFAELSPAQKALLLCWTPNESVYADHVDYPCDLNEEKRVMKSLAAIGLFCIEDYDDPEHGPCRRLFVTQAGRALVARQSGPASAPSEENT